MLALVFTDIVGSTKKCEKLGDEAWTEILISHFRRARKVLKKFNGFEIKIIGDAFMVAFQSVREAIGFAVDLQMKTGHKEVVIRAGIHVGPVRIIDNDIYGSMVNYTARLVQAIENDAVAISDAACQHLSSDISRTSMEELAEVSTFQFKSIDQAQRAWIVNADRWCKYGERHPLPDLSDCSVESSIGAKKYPLIPAETADITWIADLEASTYSAEDAISESVLRSWFDQNPCGFTVIENCHGERIGHIDILPLRRESSMPFLKGRIVEREIPPQWLHPKSEARQVRDLYVESIILKKIPGLSSSTALLCVLADFKSLVERICDPSQVENVYAIEASASGKKLMLHLGFKACGDAVAREDEHELFSVRADELQKNCDEYLLWIHRRAQV